MSKAKVLKRLRSLFQLLTHPQCLGRACAEPAVHAELAGRILKVAVGFA